MPPPLERPSRLEKVLNHVPTIALLITILWNVAQQSRKAEETSESVKEIKVWIASRDERWATTNLDVKSLGIEVRGELEQVKYRVGVLEQANGRTIPYRRGSQ